MSDAETEALKRAAHANPTRESVVPWLRSTVRAGQAAIGKLETLGALGCKCAQVAAAGESWGQARDTLDLLERVRTTDGWLGFALELALQARATFHAVQDTRDAEALGFQALAEQALAENFESLADLCSCPCDSHARQVLASQCPLPEEPRRETEAAYFILLLSSEAAWCVINRSQMSEETCRAILQIAERVWGSVGSASVFRQAASRQRFKLLHEVQALGCNDCHVTPPRSANLPWSSRGKVPPPPPGSCPR